MNSKFLFGRPIKLAVGTYLRRDGSLVTLVFAAAISVLFAAMPAVAGNQVVSGTVPAIVATLQPIGQLDGTQELNLAIGLPLRNQQGLEALLQQIYDPTSANFHQYLTPAQFTESFGPTVQDYQAVVAFAQANNLAVTYAHSNRVILDVSGTVANIEKAFHVNMLVYQHPTEARTFYAPDVDPLLNLSVTLLAIDGLSDYSLAKPAGIATVMGNAANAIPSAGPGSALSGAIQTNGLGESGGGTNADLAEPNSPVTPSGTAGVAMPNGFSGSGPEGEFYGYDFRHAYLPDTSLMGSNQLVGLLEFDGYTASDITYYETHSAPVLPNVPLTNIRIDGFNGEPSGTINSVEVTADIDLAIAMAPGLSGILVYEAPGNQNYWHDLLNRMAEDNLAKQLSASWYNNEQHAPDPVSEGIFEEMAVQGQSFFASSGDFNAHPPGTGFYFPEDSPNVTLVGGTSLATISAGGSWDSEAVWNWNYVTGCGSNTFNGSDGGISTNYAIPSWQTGVSMSGNQRSTTMRNVPDVALTADECYVYTNGLNLCFAGTSAATPLWAGLAALVNQQQANNGKAPIGFLNPALYAIGEGSGYSSDFHDITVGNNINSVSPTNFYAVSGYDLCTGWGTPKGQSLINDLSSVGSYLFANGSSLNTARRFQTAILLPNGLVLAAAGYSSTYLASAELYSTTSGTWTTTGSMNTARTQQRGVLLPNGLVLVTGGDTTGATLASAELYTPSTGAWTYTGSLSTPRVYHTLTVLPNGLALAAAGASATAELSSAELYNPASGTWTTTGSLSEARQNHTATLLPNGLVLTAGGLNDGTALTSSEVYNPATGTWTSSGSLNTARAAHTATILPNGLVLVAGGETSAGAALASAELYNPASGTWTTTGAMNVARFNHTATLLPNGFVLVAGGDNDGSGIADAELYDPTSGTWTTTSLLNTGRWGHSATLLPNGTVLVAGGYSGSVSLSSSEIYPATVADTQFVYTGFLNPGRYEHTATLLPDGAVLVAGGFNDPILSMTNSDLYNPDPFGADGTWTNAGALNTARELQTATLLPNGLVLIAGGLETLSGEGITLPYAELYNPATMEWTDTGSMNKDRMSHTATMLSDGLVLVAGGYSYSGGALTSAELYNPATGTWTSTGSMNTARTYHTATLLPNGLTLVAGGWNSSGVTTSAELYDPATGTWSGTGSLNTARAWHTATLLPDGFVLVAGGTANVVTDTGIASAELYNPASGTWTSTGSLNAARFLHTSTLLPTGLVLCAGGTDDGVYGLTSAELYNPASATWTYTGSLNYGRFYHTATLLPNGYVLFAGGTSDSVNIGNGELYYP
jgi:N-acetylneuraminic acid mutarotase